MTKGITNDAADEQMESAVKDRLARCGYRYGSDEFLRPCSVPTIPPWKGRKPKEYTDFYTSLMDVENALSKKMYPLPKSTEKEVMEACGDRKSIKEITGCVGEWVYRNIHYDHNHAGLSSSSSGVIRRNAENSEKKGYDDQCRCNEEYPLHRYMDSEEAWKARAGICGETSEIIVGILRRLGIPSTLYRPMRSHFAAISQDRKKGEMYVYDATFGSGCIYEGTKDDPAEVVTKRWSPDSAYTFGITPYKDFVEWNLRRRRILGTMKMCQAIAGVHNEETGRREGFLVDEDGDLNKEMVDFGWISWRKKRRIKKMFKRCADYLDSIYPLSAYHDVSFDTEMVIQNPPKKKLVEMFNGDEIIDLEYAYQCDPIPNETIVGRLVEMGWLEDCEKLSYDASEVERFKEDATQQEECAMEYGDISDWNRTVEDDIKKEKEIVEIGGLFKEEVKKVPEPREDADKAKLFFELYGQAPYFAFKNEKGYYPDDDELDEWLSEKIDDAIPPSER